ncbi:L-ribulose-5-phosphate 3-epimerase [Salana multivorans]
MISRHGLRNPCGVYEKALPGGTVADLAAGAARTGYDFLELAIDESPRRQERLRWSAAERAEARAATETAGAPIRVLTLSAHRRYPWGSPDPAVRARAEDLARDAIDLAADLGAECVQLAGDFSFYSPRADASRDWFVEGANRAAVHAAERGILLALENVDGVDVTSVEDGLALLDDIPGLRLYVDVGNLAGNGHDVVDQLARALPFTYAVQLKDARAGEFRRVPFGEGEVPFTAVLAFLRDVGYTGPLSVEMWNDDDDPALADAALHWLTDRATESGPAAGHECSCGTH